MSLDQWRAIPARIERAIEGLPDEALDLRGADTMSIREIVHHLVEANIIASTIMIAGLAKSGTIYDWSWVYPNAIWMRSMGYDSLPVRPALDALRTLSHYLSILIGVVPERLQREVQLRDAPDAELYTRTIEGLLVQEIEHAAEHLTTVEEIRALHGR